MPLQDTDVTLVSRGSTNANASMTQVKDYVLDGLTSSDALVWSSYPTTANNHISSANTKFDEITAIQFKNKSLSIYADNDVIVLTNLATSSAGTYKVTGRNTSTGSVSVSFIAYSNINDNTVGDRMVVTNLGPDVDTDQGNQVYINDLQPSGDNGDLWYQPSTNNFYIYNSGWVLLNKKYDNGIYYKNAVADLGIDNTGTNGVGQAIEDAFKAMFDSGARTGTIYFPAGTYLLDKKVTCINVGSNERCGWVIKGDGMSTKFYVVNDVGGIDIRFGSPDSPAGYKDNYITVEDLAIHPKAAIQGFGLYLQNGTDAEAENPEEAPTDDNDFDDEGGIVAGGSNQQYGCQVINVHILADENKPNTVEEKRNAFFFSNPLSIINFGRPRLSRVIVWNHAERSNYSFANPQGIDYSASYGFKPEDVGITLNLSNCYSPWVDNCYFNGTARYGIFWNSSRGNTEGGTFTKLVINGADIGFWIAQAREEDGETVQGRHPHLTFIDSHVNAARFGLHMNNVKYFHVADVLFYARNDKKRDVRLTDCQLINCHSGVLSNGYSGGALGNTDKKGQPEDERYRYNTLHDPELTADEKDDAKKDAQAKSPARVHVKLIGTSDIDRPAGIQKNRGIVVKDNNLNAYMCRTNNQNYTIGRALTFDGDDNPTSVVQVSDVRWVPPYQVEGPCADIHIQLPAAAYYRGPEGYYDGSQYPPENKMISSDTNSVSYSFGGTKVGIIDDGRDGDKFQRQRVGLTGESAQRDVDITFDSHKALVNNDTGTELETFVQFKTTVVGARADEHEGSYTVRKAVNGELRTAFHVEKHTAYFPVHDEENMRAREEPVISFRTPGGANNKPGIYYAES